MLIWWNHIWAKPLGSIASAFLHQLYDKLLLPSYWWYFLGVSNWPWSTTDRVHVQDEVLGCLFFHWLHHSTRRPRSSSQSRCYRNPPEQTFILVSFRKVSSESQWSRCSQNPLWRDCQSHWSVLCSLQIRITFTWLLHSFMESGSSWYFIA